MNQSNDKTVIKPRPGGKAVPVSNPTDRTIIRPRPKPGAKANVSAADDRTLIRTRPGPVHGSMQLNTATDHLQHKDSPLLNAAGTLLALATQLRQLHGKVDIQSLHQQTIDQVRQFQHKAATAINDQTICKQASYVLCALIDETVLNTTWGENSQWSQKPLLSVMHKETYGGEKVYAILEEAITTPTTHYELIELIYLVLSLGFMGKLRIDPKGPVKLEQIRSQSYEILIRSRQRYKQTLSAQTNTATGFKQKLFTFLPIWLLLASLVLMGFGVYSYWLISLNKKSDITAHSLATLIPVKIPNQLPDGRQHSEALQLRTLLAGEIDHGLLSIEDYPVHTSIILHAEELFPSGSNEIAESFFPVLDKIAKTLETIPGNVIVTGHTDNIDIRTPRYPSNWHLSLARASAVVKYLSNAGELKARLLPEGRGDSQPIESNETAQGRAKNRRVVIDIFHDLSSTQTID